MDDQTDQSTNKKDKKPNRWLWPIIIGIIVGIILMLVIYPTLSGNNSFFDEDTEIPESEEENNDNVPKEEMRVDVSSQVTDIVDDVNDTVVGVTNIQKRNDFWAQEDADEEQGTGSGVIYKVDDDHAFIVTNHHVVEEADEVEVLLADETKIEADLLGSDVFTDLAVLRADAEDIDGAIEMGTSEDLKVGEPVIAIGNPLGHMFAGSVTQGIISGKQRTIPQDFNQDGRADWQAEVIQTDAAINPGNSGGALINLEGQLIGINSMKINESMVEGIGFSIPIDAAKPIIEELEETGEVTRPYLGIESYSLEEVPKTEWEESLKLPDDVEEGIYVWSVESSSPADEAGLEKLDVITQLDGEAIEDVIDLRKILYQEKEIGDEIEIEYYRDGDKKETTVTLEEQE
ncbi:MAG TPA: S1C family serine protease [Pseudogracilibacillus sp.]|nr:S1C family serine protease [Pseudogracilibacillus sp.]